MAIDGPWAFVGALHDDDAGFQSGSAFAFRTDQFCPPALCPEDVNGDGIVNAIDLIDLLFCLGQPANPPCDTADVNQDGFVNSLDLIDLLFELGTVCP